MKRKRSTSRKPAANKRRRRSAGIRKLVKRVILGTAETKYSVSGAENQQLYHDTGAAGGFVFRGNMLGTTQGDTEETRTGDKVQAVGLSIKLMLFNKLDRPNVTYRIIVFTVPQGLEGSNNPTGFWEGDIGNKILDNVNTNRYKILKEKFIQVSGQDTTWQAGGTTVLKEKAKALQMYIPLKGRTITYHTEGGSVPKLQRDIIQLGIIAYDAYGTLQTDNIASFAVLHKFYFKDI